MHGIAAVLLHAQRQRLHAAKREETGKRIHYRADRVLHVFQLLRDVGAIPDDDGTADHVGVAVYVLGHRMQHDVDAELERALHVRRRKGVVHYRKDAARLADFRDLFQIGDLEQRIRRRFHPDHFRIGLDRFFQRTDDIRIGVTRLQAHGSVAHAFKQPPGTAVKIIRRDDVAACVQQFQHRAAGGQAGGESKPARAAFEVGDAALERMPGRVL